MAQHHRIDPFRVCVAVLLAPLAVVPVVVPWWMTLAWLERWQLGHEVIQPPFDLAQAAVSGIRLSVFVALPVAYAVTIVVGVPFLLLYSRSRHRVTVPIIFGGIVGVLLSIRIATSQMLAVTGPDPFRWTG